jgi:hypothetical protein
MPPIICRVKLHNIGAVPAQPSLNRLGPPPLGIYGPRRINPRRAHLILCGPGLFPAQPGSRTLRVRSSKLERGDPAMSDT